MTQVTHYNQFGTKAQRVVSTYKTEADERVAMDEAVRFAATWNKDERRENMRVNFILVGSNLRSLQ